MKGIVLEIKDKEAAVLCDNGAVSKIKNGNYEKGQVVNMNNKFKFIAKVGSIAAAFAITAVTGFAYTTPSTYVSLDVNPSVAYELNAFDRVISVVAVNDDGEKIVNELDVKNEKIAKAVIKTINKLKKQGYLAEDEYAGIVIAVSNKSEEKSDNIVHEIEDEINKDEEEKAGIKPDTEEKNDDEDVIKEEDKDKEDKEVKEDIETEDGIQVIVETVGRERVEEAKKLNVTPGKLNLVQKLIASTDEFDDIDEDELNELLELSVKEINKMTKENRKGMNVEIISENDDLDEDKEDENEDVEVEKNLKVVDDDENEVDDNDDEIEEDEDNIKNNTKEKNNNSNENNGNDKNQKNNKNNEN